LTPVILDKTELALKKAREELATVSGKLKQARLEAATFEAQLNAARNDRVKAEAEAREAVAVREDTITANVLKATRRAEQAEAECAEATAGLDAENASLRTKLTELQTKLFVSEESVEQARIRVAGLKSNLKEIAAEAKTLRIQLDYARSELIDTRAELKALTASKIEAVV